MAKTKEELNQLKNEYETLNNKLKELTEDELNQVAGGNLQILFQPDITSIVTKTVDENVTVITPLQITQPQVPTSPTKEYCTMIPCRCPYTKETCIHRNTSTENLYCVLYQQYVKDFE